MIRKAFRVLFGLMGASLGYGLGELVLRANIFTINNVILKYSFYGVIMSILGLLFYIVSPKLISMVEMNIEKIEKSIQNEPKEDIIVGVIGVIIGIIFAFLISLPLNLLRLPDFLGIVVILILVGIYIASVALSFRIAMKNKEEIKRLFAKKKHKETTERITTGENVSTTSTKLLDTSVIIDGRIKQIVASGFIEGSIVIPNFVLEELQFIADSADEIKRERGRRGLDIVKDLQSSKKINVLITDKDYIETKEVDIKLLKYATETGSSIITNDFNLNKLAVVQGIKVLNINDLANSVKTVVIPGEKMIVTIIKEGREKQQGLAYLEDGTMIVVEDAKHLIGETLEVMVTSVLQTAAGKMIFTKIIND